MKLLFIGVVVLMAGACQKDDDGDGTKGSSGDFTAGQKLLEASELEVPKFEPLSKLKLESEIASDKDLFEFSEGSESKPDQETVECTNALYARYPIQAKANTLRIYLKIDAEFFKCVFAKLIAPSTKQSDRADEKLQCANSNSDYRSEVSGFNDEIHAQFTGDKDLSEWNGKSIQDLGSNAFSSTVLRTGTSLNETRSEQTGVVCNNKKFAGYIKSKVKQESCQNELLDEESNKANCEGVTITRLKSVEAGSALSEAEVKKYLDSEHYIQTKTVNVKTVEGKNFPVEGTKEVKIRNWKGTITFRDGEPTYEFTDSNDSTNKVSGTFKTPASK